MLAEIAVTRSRAKEHMGSQKLLVGWFLPFICSPSLFLLPGTKAQSWGCSSHPMTMRLSALQLDRRSWNSNRMRLLRMSRSHLDCMFHKKETTMQ